MENQSEICRANARQCRAIALRPHAPEDRVEFTAFAESWDRLANQIEVDQRLIDLIDELAGSDPQPEETLQEPIEPDDDESAAAGSLRRLAALISDRFAEPDADAA